MNRPKAFCYARKSHSSQNLDSQVAEIQRWCDNNNFEAVWFKDTGTGTNLEREEFKRLQKEIFMGEAKVVVVTEVSRISRNLIDGMTTVADWLAKDIRLVATTQSFDFSGAMGQMIASLLFNFASIETEQRRLRQARGIEQARKENKYKGRVVGSFSSNPDRMLDHRFAGKTIEEIATLENVNRTTVIRHLNERARIMLFDIIGEAYENLGFEIDCYSVTTAPEKFRIEDDRLEEKYYPDWVSKAVEKASRTALKKAYSNEEYKIYMVNFCTEFLGKFWEDQQEVDASSFIKSSFLKTTADKKNRKLNNEK